ncbi:MAG: hypothetical protein JSW27_02685 [Phycisphaerales bacterium]|nr:MAG: hypothetical protein JSW27_02685 [Phycisphaerales bacterium]
MTVLVMALVVLAALLPVAAGVWVALALMAALRHRTGTRIPPEGSPPADPA